MYDDGQKLLLNKNLPEDSKKNHLKSISPLLDHKVRNLNEGTFSNGIMSKHIVDTFRLIDIL